MEESILKERFEDFSTNVRICKPKPIAVRADTVANLQKKNIAKTSSLQFCIILIFHQLDEHYVNIY